MAVKTGGLKSDGVILHPGFDSSFSCKLGKLTHIEPQFTHLLNMQVTAGVPKLQGSLVKKTV